MATTIIRARSTCCSAALRPLLPAPGTRMREEHDRLHRPPTLWGCAECGGIHATMTRREAGLLLGVGLEMAREAEDARYFDIYFTDAPTPVRSHGWFCRNQLRVVQYG